MTIPEPEIIAEQSIDEGEPVLIDALRAGVPIVAFLAQMAGWTDGRADPALRLALQKISRAGDDWKSLLAREPLPDGFYEWLGERFVNRHPSPELLATADAALSAVYTSSIDPSLLNLFATEGRQPEAVLLGDPPPPVVRSRRRVPIYYLFGRAGAGVSDFVPPSTTQALSQRRIRHASAMLRTLSETATPLGLIIVDSYDPAHDWLRAEDLLAVLGSAPPRGVLWCGADPKFSEEDRETYQGLVEQGIIARDRRPLGQLFALLKARGEDIGPQRWDEPEVVSLSGGKRLVTTPRLRLSTQASAAIIDDSWLGFLPPLSQDAERSSFAAFHAVATGTLGLFEGLRRGFAIQRNFETQLQKRVARAISQHHLEKGAIIVHGQSGVGKTIALGRLALSIRQDQSAAVLFAYNRLLQASDVADFLSEVDKINGVTVVIVDATSSFQRHDDLLEAFRSRGHRTVVVGSSYRIDTQLRVGRDRFLEAPSELSESERRDLVELSQRFESGDRQRFSAAASQPHALARFFWELPNSRTRLSEGLGREARTTEVTLGTRGARKRPVQNVGNLGLALIDAGYTKPTAPTIDESEPKEPGVDTAAGRMIDYVMTSSRLYKWVPVNLVLRAVLSQGIGGNTSTNIEVVRDLFEGQDIFRWRFADEQGEELLVGARLQIEAELVCNRRIGGPNGEAERLIELIRCAVRAGSEDNEETKFLTDLVYALGPDGPFKERYRDSYSAIARALSELRQRHGVQNARLILQEATLRRHYVRTHMLTAEQKAALLDEARAAIDEALQALTPSVGHRLYASRRTRENLWVERAATYGFLATDSVQRGASAQEVWSSYRAAREAVRMATGRVDTYFPLDIGLWLPTDILRANAPLGPTEKLELEADIRSTLDLVDPEALDATQVEIFQRQRFRVGEVLADVPLAEEAFAALAAVGSTAGYYLRARRIAPNRPEKGEVASAEDRRVSRIATQYLWSVYDHISADARCLVLLLSCEWTAITGRWSFRGQRQPLPFKAEDRGRLRNILLDLLSVSSQQVQAKYRYLEAVLNWLTNDEAGARESFRLLARETEYIDRGRVINRHVIADAAGQPLLFTGLVERQIGDNRWSVLIEALSRRVDLTEGEWGASDITIGRTIRDVAVSFNYLGPIADRYHGRLLRT